MKLLIATADDVGLHRGMTLGTIQAHRQGIVTACSVVANGREFDHAAEQLRDVPTLDVGVHLTLVEERPLSNPKEVGSLMTQEARFLKNYALFVRRYALGGINPAELEKELRAQIERVLAAGLPIRHLNSHQHLHVLPGVFELVMKLADEYKVGYVRFPIDRPSGTVLEKIRVRALAIRILGEFAERAKARTKKGAANDRTIGVTEAGHLTSAKLVALLDDVEGVTELVCHPGIDDRAIASFYDWGYEWDGETAALCDPAVRASIQEKQIVLGGIRDLRV